MERVYMGRQSHKAIERLKHIASLPRDEAISYLAKETGHVIVKCKRCNGAIPVKQYDDHPGLCPFCKRDDAFTPNSVLGDTAADKTL
jgi:hypothetical protein